jgi:hypothetical protein
MHKNITMNLKKRFTPAFTDLFLIAFVTIFLLILSYFFNIFVLFVELFQKNPKALTFIDEIITLLVSLSVGLAVFSWRRWSELKKETAERIRLQEELTRIAETKAETERIISKQLHTEIELRKSEEKKPFINPNPNKLLKK